MYPNRPVIDAQPVSPDRFPVKTRAAISNRDLLPGLDGRSASARQFRDLVHRFVSDMGGLDHCSEVKLGLMRGSPPPPCRASYRGAGAVNGEPVASTELCTLASTTVRIATRLGLERVPRDVTPNLGDLLRADLEQQRGGSSSSASAMGLHQDFRASADPGHRVGTSRG